MQNCPGTSFCSRPAQQHRMTLGPTYPHQITSLTCCKGRGCVYVGGYGGRECSLRLIRYKKTSDTKMQAQLLQGPVELYLREKACFRAEGCPGVRCAVMVMAFAEDKGASWRQSIVGARACRTVLIWVARRGHRNASGSTSCTPSAGTAPARQGRLRVEHNACLACH